MISLTLFGPVQWSVATNFPLLIARIPLHLAESTKFPTSVSVMLVYIDFFFIFTE